MKPSPTRITDWLSYRPLSLFSPWTLLLVQSYPGGLHLSSWDHRTGQVNRETGAMTARSCQAEWSDTHSLHPQVQLMTTGFQSEADEEDMCPSLSPLYDSAQNCQV